MSSTTRVGFVVPAVGDFADETIYFDDNITTYENELPVPMAISPPATGNYAGRCRAYDVAAVTSPPQPEYPFYSMLYNGSSWIPLGSAGTRRNCAKNTAGNGSSLPNTSSSEVFQPSPLPNFSGINVTAGQVIKFCCNYDIGWYSTTGQTMTITGAFNIFIDPNSATQPTPTTPGVIRLSDVVSFGDDYYAGNDLSGGIGHGSFEGFYSELFYLATTTRTIGVAAYLSATNVDASGGGYVGIYDPANTGLPLPPDVSLGIGATQFMIETCGTWSA